MKVWRIDNLVIQPFMVLADSVRHAEQTFIFSLMTGLGNRPEVVFDVEPWGDIADPLARRAIEQFAGGPLPGIVWNVDDGAGWELVPKSFIAQ